MVYSLQFILNETLRRIDLPLGAIPFKIHTPPTDEVSKILTPKKKSADTKHPSEICEFSPYPSEKSQRSKDADRLNPSETTF